MTQRSTRIRWSPEERETLLTAYEKLVANHPKREVDALFMAAQKALPARRRRVIDYKIRAWLATAGKRPVASRRASVVSGIGPALAVAPEVRRPKRGAVANNSAKRVPATKIAGTAPRNAPTATSLPGDIAAIAQLMVEHGGAIVAGILENPRVRDALRSLVATVLPALSPPPPSTAPTPAAAPPSAPADD